MSGSRKRARRARSRFPSAVSAIGRRARWYDGCNSRDVITRMNLAMLGAALLIPAAVLAHQTDAVETFTATASIKNAHGAAATLPVTISVARKMSREEADVLIAAYRAGGVSALRAALEPVPPTGVVRVGDQSVTARVTIERPTDKGRLLTIVADGPLILPSGAAPVGGVEGCDFTVIDLEETAGGDWTGVLAPAAQIATSGKAFVITDLAKEVIWLSAVTRQPQ
jgi:hypothetical protein